MGYVEDQKQITIPDLLPYVKLSGQKLGSSLDLSIVCLPLPSKLFPITTKWYKIMIEDLSNRIVH